MKLSLEAKVTKESGSYKWLISANCFLKSHCFFSKYDCIRGEEPLFPKATRIEPRFLLQQFWTAFPKHLHWQLERKKKGRQIKSTKRKWPGPGTTVNLHSVSLDSLVKKPVKLLKSTPLKGICVIFHSAMLFNKDVKNTHYEHVLGMLLNLKIMNTDKDLTLDDTFCLMILFNSGHHNKIPDCVT